MPPKTSQAEAATKTVEIPSMQLARMSVRLKGETPLITHRFGPRAIAAIEAAQQQAGRARVARPARDPDADFRDALYVIEGDRFGFPGAGIKKALVSAGGRFADEQMTRLRGVVNVLGDLVEIHGSKPRMRTDAVRLPSGGGVAYRPEFFPWRMEVPVFYNATLLSEAQLLNLFSIAGFSIGLGDWRPEKGGVFGQFTVEEAKG